MKNFFKKQLFRHSSRQAGFTLIEITIVIFIITMGLIGVLSLATQTIKISNFNKNEFIASQLAQEGIELVRKERDRNWMQGLLFNNDISDGGMGYTFGIDYLGYKPSVSDIDKLGANLKIVNGFYELDEYNSGGTVTPYYRMITTNKYDEEEDYKLEVESWVRWRDSGGVHDYEASTVLYDWK